MKRVVKVLLVIILLMPFCVDGKEVNISGHIYGVTWFTDIYTSVLETDDSYIVGGYGASDDIYGVPAQGYYDIRIYKYNKDTLKIQSQIVYGGSSNEELYSMIQNANNELVFVGSTYSEDIEGITIAGNVDAIIVKYDSNGNMIWQKNYGGSEYDYFNSVKNTLDGGYIVAGYSYSNDIDGLEYLGREDALLVKYDNDGNVVWQKNWGSSNYDKFYDVIEVDDGYIVVGESTSEAVEECNGSVVQDAVIVKFDLKGNFIWKKSFGGSDYDKFEKLEKFSDGSVAAVGMSWSDDISNFTNNGFCDGIIVRYDKNGNMIWSKNYGGTDEDTFTSIKLITNDELIVTGTTFSSDIDGVTYNGMDDALVLKYDKDGNLLKQYNFGGNYWDLFYDIIPAKKGYVAVGISNSTNFANIPYGGGYEGGLIVEFAINYDLQKENDNIKNGTYELTQVGQRAEISINPDNGYELDKIIVKDLSGNELTYYEENGKYYVDLTDDIVVDVKYKQKSIFNPNTGGLLMIGEIILLLIGLYGSFYFIKKKKSLVI